MRNKRTHDATLNAGKISDSVGYYYYRPIRSQHVLTKNRYWDRSSSVPLLCPCLPDNPLFSCRALSALTAIYTKVLSTLFAAGVRHSNSRCVSASVAQAPFRGGKPFRVDPFADHTRVSCRTHIQLLSCLKRKNLPALIGQPFQILRSGDANTVIFRGKITWPVPK